MMLSYPNYARSGETKTGKEERETPGHGTASPRYATVHRGIDSAANHRLQLYVMTS